MVEGEKKFAPVGHFVYLCIFNILLNTETKMKKLIVFMTLAMAMGVGVAGAQTKNGESKPAEGPKSITLEDIWTKGTFRTKGV